MYICFIYSLEKRDDDTGDFGRVDSSQVIFCEPYQVGWEQSSDIMEIMIDKDNDNNVGGTA